MNRDGSSDMSLFEFCGMNSKLNVREYAEHSLETDDLMDILKYILKKKVSGNSYPMTLSAP